MRCASPVASWAGVSALPLTPVLPLRLCPIPGPLYTVLMGYKESPVAEARARYAAMPARLLREFLAAHAGCVAAVAGGPLGVALCVPSTARPDGAPLTTLVGMAEAAGGGRGLLVARSCSAAPPLRSGICSPTPAPSPSLAEAHRRLDGNACCCSTTPTSAGRGRRAPRPRCGWPERPRWSSSCSDASSGPTALPPTPPSCERTGVPGPKSAAKAHRAAGVLRPGRPACSARRSAPPRPTRAPRRRPRRGRVRDGVTTRGGPESWSGPPGPTYCPPCTDDEVAAQRTGRAPAAVGCPIVAPAARASFLRTRPPFRSAPLPARLLRVQPGCAATAMVRSAAAAEPALELGHEEKVGQLRRAVGLPRVGDPDSGDVVEPAGARCGARAS